MATLCMEKCSAEVEKRAAEAYPWSLQMMVKRFAEAEKWAAEVEKRAAEEEQRRSEENQRRFKAEQRGFIENLRRVKVDPLLRLINVKMRTVEVKKRAAEEELRRLKEGLRRSEEEQRRSEAYPWSLQMTYPWSLQMKEQRRSEEEQKKRDQEEQKKRDQEEQKKRDQESYAVRRIIELQETQKVGGLEKESGRERLHLLNLIAFGRSGDRNGSLNRLGLVLSAPRDSDREGGGSSGCFCGSSGSSGFVPDNGGSGYSYSSSGSSGGYCGTNGAGGGFNHDGSGLRTRPGGTGTADGGSSGCSYGSSGSSGCAPGNHCGTNGACGGSEETPNDHSGSSGNSGFPGSPGMLHSTPDGTGRPDGLLAHGYIITRGCVCAGQQKCTVTLEVGRRDSFDSASMVSGDWSRWEEVPLSKEDKRRSSVMEARLTLFGREQRRWKLDRDTSIVQAIDLKLVDQGRTVSISWELGNKEPGRMTDLHCAVEMCQHRRGQDGATETTEPTKFPLTLHARDFSSLNAPAGNNDDSPVYREGIPSVGQLERNVAFLVGMVAQLKTGQDETVLLVSRLKQQQEIDNRTIAELKNFKEKFSQVQPSSED